MTPKERAQSLENSDHCAWDEDFKAALIEEFRQVRLSTLEEAAREVDSENPHDDWLLSQIAAAIRALKEE